MARPLGHSLGFGDTLRAPSSVQVCGLKLLSFLDPGCFIFTNAEHCRYNLVNDDPVSPKSQRYKEKYGNDSLRIWAQLGGTVLTN